MAKIKISLQEHIATLQRSSLPTLVTEGVDDRQFLRLFADHLSEFGVDLYPAGGRDMVIELFNSRKLFKRNNILFLADLDTFVYSSIPADFVHRKMMFTDGYSIENDLYRDGNIEDLLYKREREVFLNQLKSIVKWYSFCLERKLDFSASDIPYSCHPYKVIDRITGRIREEISELIGYTDGAGPLYESIFAQYDKLLRGKTLLELIVQHLSGQNCDLSGEERRTKFGKAQLMEMACSRRGELYNKIYLHARDFFASQPVAP
jgi:hypothetical protein